MTTTAEHGDLQPRILPWDEITSTAEQLASLCEIDKAEPYFTHLKPPPWDLVAIDPQSKSGLIGQRCHTWDAVRAFITLWSGKRNCYCHVNEMRAEKPSGKASKTDIGTVYNLHCDVDFKDIAKLLPQETDRVKREAGLRMLALPFFPGDLHSFASDKLRTLSLYPSMRVETGGGFNYYWRLKQPLIIETPDDIERIEAINKALSQHLCGDSVHDMSRILRVPHTVNIPNEKKRKDGRFPVIADHVVIYREAMQEVHEADRKLDELKRQQRKADRIERPWIAVKVSKAEGDKEKASYNFNSNKGEYLKHDLEWIEFEMSTMQPTADIVDLFPNKPATAARNQDEILASLPEKLRNGLYMETAPGKDDRSGWALAVTTKLIAQGLTDNELLELDGMPFMAKYAGGSKWRDEIKRVRDKLHTGKLDPAKGEKQPQWKTPVELGEDTLPVQAFTYELMPEAFRPYVRDIAERMQCPPDFIAMAVMTAAGVLLGRKIALQPKQFDTLWTVVANMWCLIIGPPGILKSPAVEEALSYLKMREAKAADAFTADTMLHGKGQQKAKLKHDLKLKSIRDQAGKNPSLDIDKMFDELEDEDSEAPAQKRYMTNAVTVEKLGRILSENPQGILIHRDEIVSLLTTLDREEKATDKGFYMTGWNGDSSYNADTVGSGTIRVDAICLSLLGTTQPAKIGRYMKRALDFAGDDGLVARFGLLVWPDITKDWINVDRVFDDEARKRAHLAYERLDEMTGEKAGATDSGKGVPVMRLTEDALAIFNVWREELEKRLRSNELHPALQAHFAKYRKLVPSLALVCGLVDGDTGAIGAASVQRAIDWATYLESHAMRAYGAVTTTANSAGRAILKAIQRQTLKAPFTARDVTRLRLSGLSDKRDVQEALELLEDLHWIASQTREPSMAGGRQTVEYLPNPALTAEGVVF